MNVILNSTYPCLISLSIQNIYITAPLYITPLFFDTPTLHYIHLSSVISPKHTLYDNHLYIPSTYT